MGAAVLIEGVDSVIGSLWTALAFRAMGRGQDELGFIAVFIERLNESREYIDISSQVKSSHDWLRRAARPGYVYGPWLQISQNLLKTEPR